MSKVEMRLELITVPVSDVDRAKAFYVDQVGFNPDHDHVVSEDLRFVQLTPPGSACSIAIGSGLTEVPPGSVQGLQVVVEDIEAAHAALAEAQAAALQGVPGRDWAGRTAEQLSPMVYPVR